MRCLDIGALRAMDDGELRGEERRRAREHLADCGACRTEMTVLHVASSLLPEAFEAEPPRPSPPCPSEDSLVAFAAQSLSEPDMARIRDHVSSCGACFDQAGSLTLDLQAAEAARSDVIQRPGWTREALRTPEVATAGRPRDTWSAWLAPAAAAATVALLILPGIQREQRQVKAQLASLQAALKSAHPMMAVAPVAAERPSSQDAAVVHTLAATIDRLSQAVAARPLPAPANRAAVASVPIGGAHGTQLPSGVSHEAGAAYPASALLPQRPRRQPAGSGAAESIDLEPVPGTDPVPGILAEAARENAIGQTDAAVSTLRLSLESHPKRVELHAELLSIYRQAGNNDGVQTETDWMRRWSSDSTSTAVSEPAIPTKPKAAPQAGMK